MDICLNRNLLRDFRRYNRAWLPAKEERLERILYRLEKDFYSGQIDGLIADLHLDPILYLSALREASADEGLDNTLRQSLRPDELFRFAGFEKLSKIIKNLKLDTYHDELREEKQFAFREMNVAARLAETFAESLSLPHEIAYSASLLRGFGVTLISWNSPELYLEAMESSRDADDVDRFFTRELGYSSRLIGALFSAEWSLCPEVQVFLGNNEPQNALLLERRQQVKQLCETLREIVRASEALASLSNKMYQPQTDERWKSISLGLKRLLGGDALTIVQRALEDEYSEALDVILNIKPDKPVKPLRPSSGSIGQPIQERKSEQAISPGIREQSAIVRELLSKHQDRSAALRYLIDEVVPRTGFRGGSLYLFDPNSMRLKRRLVFGDVPDSDRASFPVLANASDSHLVQAAYNCNMPLFEHSNDPVAKLADGIACVLGRSRRSGVLLLRVNSVRLQRGDIEPRKGFKMLLELFSDALDIY